jgi:hypothetical protein
LFRQESAVYGDDDDFGLSNGRPRPGSLAAEVLAVAERETAYRELCGEMLATILLPENRGMFDQLGPVWADAVSCWKRRFDAVDGGGRP